MSSTNAPGGRWYSTPAAARRAKPRNLTLTPEASAALDWLAEQAGGKGRASSEASDAIVAHATSKGWTR